MFVISDIIPPKFELVTDYVTATQLDVNLHALDCDVEGLPFPDIVWYKEEKLLDKQNLSTSLGITNKNQR